MSPSPVRRLALIAAATALAVAACIPAHAAAQPTAAARLSASEGELVVTGRALAAAGVPLPEADVQLLAIPSAVDAAAAVMAGRVPVPVARVKSDGAGRYRLAAPAPGAWRVRIEAAGRVAVQSTPLLLVDAQDLGDAELPADQGLVVTVTAGGKPLAGALVQAVPAGVALRRTSTWARAPQSVLTAADGTARVARASSDGLQLAAIAAGHAPVLAGPARSSAFRLALEAGAGVPLMVVSAAGKPAAGALVSRLDDPRQPLAFTDAEGRATVVLPGGAARMRVALEAPDGALATATLEPPPPDRPATAQRITLDPPRTLTGAVIDLETRRAVAGALVYDERDERRAVRTGADGRFTLLGSGAGTFDVTAAARGYIAGSLEQRPAGTSATFALRPAAAIEGTVVSAAGEPVAGAEVSATEAEPPVRGGMRDVRIVRGGPPRVPRVITGADGRFRIAGLDPEKSFDLAAKAAGFAPGKLEVGGLAPRRTRGGQVIRLERGADAVVQVVDDAARPVANAEVRLRPSAQGDPLRMVRALRGPEPEPERVLTDREGRASFAHLAAGRYDVEASHAGYARGTLAAVELGEGKPPDLGRIVLETGVTLDGVVVDAAGQPVEGAEIGLAAPGSSPFRFPGPSSRTPDAVTGADGRFAVYDRRRGETVDVEAKRAGFAPATLGGVAVPATEPLRVVLHPAATLAGHVIDEDGRAIGGASIALRREARGGGGPLMMVGIAMMSARAGNDGRFSFEGLSPGRVSLRITAPGWQDRELPAIDIAEGANPDELEVRLEPSAVLEGRVLFADGTPAIGATVSPVETSASEMPRFRMGATGGADGDGRYRLDGLKPGPQSIEARHDAAPRLARDVELRRGTNTLDLRFEGGQELRGRVVDAAGAPVAGADVRAGSSARPFAGGLGAKSDADGAFRIPGLVDGTYQLTASRTGFAPSTVPVTVAGAPVNGIEVRLLTGSSIAGNVRGVSPGELAAVQIMAFTDGPGGMVSASPDQEGAFRIDNLAPGGWHLTATVQGSGRSAAGDVTLADGQPEARVDLDFGRGFSLAGRVLLGEDPVADAWVIVAGSGLSSANSRTGADGRFRLEGLDKGVYRLLVNQWEQGLQHAEDVTLDADREVVVRLPKMAVAGRVIDAADRTPLENVEVRIVTDAGGLRGARRAAVSDASGRFQVANVPAGTWRVTASRPGYAAREASVTVAEGSDTSSVELLLEASEGLTLLVRGASGAIPDEVQVAVQDGAGRTVAGGLFPTAENGRVRIGGVPPGSWSLLAAAGESATTALEVSGPGPAIAVTLPAACTLDVEVPALAGSSTPAIVALTGSDGRPYRALRMFGPVSDAWPLTAGRVRVPDVPPGTWTVTVTAGEQRFTSTVTTAPAVAAKVVLK